MADQPTNIPQSFAGLQEAFLPDRAANVNKTIQFNFTGAEESVWRLVIANGALSYGQGAAEAPNAIATVDSEDWLRLLRGELIPMSAVISGKLKIKGDPMLLAQFQTWFRPPA
ncbi:MAG TPA: SCP2 sterol-binding domain-containing protein [Ktedonobacterales bacterium]|jgi:putative sterol carrier protein|nr:SCP2 sterol-binding domain-containing protein [Ktedonobacterales bacterium]